MSKAMTQWLGVALCMVFACCSAQAQWVVFDPTNFAKNTLTAAQTAQQVQKQIQANLIKMEQLAELVQARKQLPSDVLYGSGFASVGELTNRMGELRSMLAAVNGLKGGLEDMNGRFNFQFNMAQRAGLTLQQYYGKLVQEAQTGVAKSQAVISADQQALQRVNRTYEQVKTWQNGISGIDSQVGGLQLLNSQMSQVVSQNGEMISYLAKASMSKESADIDAQAARNAKVREEVQTSEKARDTFNSSRDAVLNRLRGSAAQAAP